MSIGFNKPLYVLPFDHRASFSKELFGWQGTLSNDQVAQIAASKRIIFDAINVAVANGVPAERAGILVDEQFGAEILHDALKEGLITACPAEKSGQAEFDFEYGAEFAKHIETFNPTFCKVLVRYNPEGDHALNERQSERLKQLSDYLHKAGRLFMFELLVPATPAQLQSVGNDKSAYDDQLRPNLMIEAIHELQDAGVEPDVWKIEGLDRGEDCQNIVAAAGGAGRDGVGCIILGRHETDTKVRHWLTTAAATPGFIGFAIGRTAFWDPLVKYLAKKITRDEAVQEIAASYEGFVELFENAKQAAPVGVGAS